MILQRDLPVPGYETNRRAPSRFRSSLPDSHRSEEHTSELQSPCNLVCRLLLEKKKFLDCSHVSFRCRTWCRVHLYAWVCCLSIFLHLFFFFLNVAAAPKISLLSLRALFPF